MTETKCKEDFSMDIRTYEHENYGKLRLFCKDGFYWFIGKDVAIMLGYKNPSDALSKHVNYEDKCLTKVGGKTMAAINGCGLYSLIASSKSDNAQDIRRWITEVVVVDMHKCDDAEQAENRGEELPSEILEAPEVDAKTQLYTLTIKYKIAKQMTKLWDRAGVAPKYQAVGLNRHYDTIAIPDDVLDALPDEE